MFCHNGQTMFVYIPKVRGSIQSMVLVRLLRIFLSRTLDIPMFRDSLTSPRHGMISLTRTKSRSLNKAETDLTVIDKAT